MGVEWALVREGLGLLWALVEDAPDDGAATGIGLFDHLPAASRVALLAEVAAVLRLRAVPPPPPSAVADAAVAAVFEIVHGAVHAEALDGPGDGRWRRLVRAAHARVGDPELIPPGTTWGPDEWDLAIGGLRDRVLEDTDYALADLALDAPPEVIRWVRAALRAASYSTIRPIT